MASTFRDLNPALKKEPRLVEIRHREGDGDDRCTLYCIKPRARGRFLIAEGVDRKIAYRLMNVWEEALRFAARVRRKSPGECLPTVTADYRVVLKRNGPITAVRYMAVMVLCDPAEIVLDRVHGDTHECVFVDWSDGVVEECRHFHPCTGTSIFAHQILGVMYVLQRVERFAARDGDHAIGTRVMRFLVHPVFLLGGIALHETQR